MFLLNYLKNKGVFNEFADKSQLKKDILSGITVALALIPESIAFSFVVGINPIIGLHTSFIIGLITAIFGGRPAMISAFTGALALIMGSLLSSYGIEYLYLAVILMGVIQIIFGFLGGGKLFRLIPYTVMLGFLNGLAILIFLAQIKHFKIDGEWIAGYDAIIMIFLVLLTMFIIYFLPKITKSVPSELVAIIVVTLIVFLIPGFDDTRTIYSYLIENGFDSLVGSLPSFNIPEIQDSIWKMLYVTLPVSLMLFAVGTIETLMTLGLVDDLTDSRGKSNKEVKGQGLANIISGFFGGVAGCAMVGQSVINVKNGGRGRISGITASLVLMMLILFAVPFINLIPIASLVGLMFMVVIGTFAWPTLKMLNKIPIADSFVIILTTLITVYTHDLALAVVIGVVISALVFAWQKSTHIEANRYIDNKLITHYELDGPLFFASVERFNCLFDLEKDTNEIIIDFAKSRVMDHSAIEAINNLTSRYRKKGKILHLKHLSNDCKQMIKDADEIIDVNIYEDPKYKVANI
ncbi:SulP family inorganic anion transporter [Candidatus Vampirococcus lugosii]|uniref:Sulfate permease n=1 Tax=Candidatus Vampirococcus lugosii TaxID=2789015 RepID=A0ABS5QL50_9BACT|nr:SulP family inorganic anion transporter [Candidatus Vampirococcus lugosii]MBS8121508.1 sulfate permease [Candidatus Vampirococcus lugosii]